jgi:hypothetical protein
VRFDRDIARAIDIDADPAAVWDELQSIERHVDWMDDAVAIDFHSAQRRGVGTRFVCATKVGPFRLSDEMEVTGWTEGVEIAVVHRGLVVGAGTFRLMPIDHGRRCRVTWSETLSFPWWMGGPIGASIGARVLGRIWEGNLRNLQRELRAHR